MFCRAKHVTDRLLRSRTNIVEKKTNDRHLSLSGRIQMAYFECMKRLSGIAQTASRYVNATSDLAEIQLTSTSGMEQGKQLLATTSKIL